VPDHCEQPRKTSKQSYRQQLRNIRRELGRIEIQRIACKSKRVELATYAIAALKADRANLDT